MSYKKGDMVVMLFHGFGTTSEEEYPIYEVHDDGTITLDTDEELEKCFRFDVATGRCINDRTDFGCSRTLKLQD